MLSFDLRAALEIALHQSPFSLSSSFCGIGAEIIPHLLLKCFSILVSGTIHIIATITITAMAACEL